MKYLPNETEPVDACKWRYDNIEAVQEFLVMLSMNNLKYTFESEDQESWDVEIHIYREGVELPVAIVGSGRWLLIHANGTLETMADQPFKTTYRLA